MNRKYNAQRDVPDHRDLGMFRYMLAPKAQPLPTKISHLVNCGPFKDQGSEGSCTGHAGSEMGERLVRVFPEAFEHLYGMDPNKVQFSPQSVYRVELEKESGGNPTEDAGAQIRTIVWALNHRGACLETTDPYVPGGWAVPLTAEQIGEAYNFRLGAYHRLGSVDDMKACLAYGSQREQYTFVAGFAVYSSFESGQVARDGLMPMPRQTEELLGGHAVHVIGYDDSVRCPHTQFPGAFEVQNSWGKDWGQGGRFWMPYEFAADSDYLWDAWMQHMGPAWR